MKKYAQIKLHSYFLSLPISEPMNLQNDKYLQTYAFSFMHPAAKVYKEIKAIRSQRPPTAKGIQKLKAIRS